jgi:hypothetical protein
MRLRIDLSQTGVAFPAYIPTPYSAEVRADVTAGYRWVVKDGVLGVEPLRHKVTDSYGDTAVWFGINGPSERAHTDLIGGLLTDVPEGIRDEARAEQLVEVVDAGNDEATSCESEDDCTVAGTRALSFVRTQLNIAKEATPPLLSGAELQNLKSLFERRSEWVCTQRANRASKTCNVLLRAKRVNAYPDGVELVFREGGERPMTREFALETIARNAVRTKVLETNPMCDAPVHGEKLRMNFVNQVQHATYD